jgi:hypothetical protein
MTDMTGVTVTLVHVVDMVLMRDAHVATALTVTVLVTRVLAVPGGRALVDVTVVPAMQVAVMHVVDMVPMRHGHVATPVSVGVLMLGMLQVRGSAHDVFSSIVVCGSVVWRTASRAICATWSSTSS